MYIESFWVGYHLLKYGHNIYVKQQKSRCGLSTATKQKQSNTNTQKLPFLFTLNSRDWFCLILYETFAKSVLCKFKMSINLAMKLFKDLFYISTPLTPLITIRRKCQRWPAQLILDGEKYLVPCVENAFKFTQAFKPSNLSHNMVTRLFDHSDWKYNSRLLSMSVEE